MANPTTAFCNSREKWYISGTIAAHGTIKRYKPRHAGHYDNANEIRATVMPFFYLRQFRTSMLSGQLTYLPTLPTDYANWIGRVVVLTDGEDRRYVCDGVQWLDQSLLTGGGGGSVTGLTPIAGLPAQYDTLTEIVGKLQTAMQTAAYDTNSDGRIDTRFLEQFTYAQPVSAALWTINHNLNKFPQVTVRDTGGNVALGDVTHIDNNTLTIAFSPALAGTAELS